MKKETMKEANELNNDIENLDKVLSEHKKYHWIKVIFKKGLNVTCPYEDLYYSTRFQDELAEWLKQKKEQYQKELDAL